MQVLIFTTTCLLCTYSVDDETGSWVLSKVHGLIMGFLIILSSAAAAAKLLQSCPTLCDPINGSSPGFPIPGILQARTLEWVAISFSNA